MTGQRAGRGLPGAQAASEDPGRRWTGGVDGLLDSLTSRAFLL